MVADILAAMGGHVVGCVTIGSHAPGPGVPQRRCLGDLDHADARLPQADRDGFVAAIGSNDVRARAFDRAVRLGLTPIAAVHPTAALVGDAQVEPGAQVCAGADVGVGAVVGENAIINTGRPSISTVASVGTPFWQPGVHMAGRVEVGAEAFVGIGAVVSVDVRIGAGGLVAAGAVVSDVPDGVPVAGVPATRMRSQGEG